MIDMCWMPDSYVWISQQKADLSIYGSSPSAELGDSEVQMFWVEVGDANVHWMCHWDNGTYRLRFASINRNTPEKVWQLMRFEIKRVTELFKQWPVGDRIETPSFTNTDLHPYLCIPIGPFWRQFMMEFRDQVGKGAVWTVDVFPHILAGVVGKTALTDGPSLGTNVQQEKKTVGGLKRTYFAHHRVLHHSECSLRNQWCSKLELHSVSRFPNI